MIIPYPNNTKDFVVEYHREKIGTNWFMTFYKNISRQVATVKDMRAVLGPAKFLDSSQKLYEWMEEMVNAYDSDPTEAGRVDTSFASEVLAEEGDKTRMVV